MNLFESKIKNALFELLKDNEIKEIIRKITNENDFMVPNLNNEKTDNFEKKIIIITEENSNLIKLSGEKEKIIQLQNDTISDLESKINMTTEENKKLKKAIDEKEKIIQSQIDAIEALNQKNNKLTIELGKNSLSELELDSIKELMTHYNYYRNMPESTKISLKYIIDDSNPLNFYSCGMQERAIDAFWELLKQDIFSDCKNENLNSIFEYFFRNSYSGLSKETFIPLETRIGDKYSEEEHIKAPWSKQLGAISKVLLLGYTKNGSNKIEKKSIVVI